MVSLPTIARLSRLSCPQSAALGSTVSLGIAAEDAAYHHRLQLTLGSKQLEQAVEAGRAAFRWRCRCNLRKPSLPPRRAQATPAIIYLQRADAAGQYGGGVDADRSRKCGAHGGHS